MIEGTQALARSVSILSMRSNWPSLTGVWSPPLSCVASTTPAAFPYFVNNAQLSGIAYVTSDLSPRSRPPTKPNAPASTIAIEAAPSAMDGRTLKGDPEVHEVEGDAQQRQHDEHRQGQPTLEALVVSPRRLADGYGWVSPLQHEVPEGEPKHEGEEGRATQQECGHGGHGNSPLRIGASIDPAAAVVQRAA